MMCRALVVVLAVAALGAAAVATPVGAREGEPQAAVIVAQYPDRGHTEHPYPQSELHHARGRQLAVVDTAQLQRRAVLRRARQVCSERTAGLLARALDLASRDAPTRY